MLRLQSVVVQHYLYILLFLNDKKQKFPLASPPSRPPTPAGFVIVWVCFAKYYDYRKHVWRKRKYEGASEYSNNRGISVIRFLKRLGEGNADQHQHQTSSPPPPVALCVTHPDR